MAVTGTYNVREICTAALRMAGIGAIGEAPAAEDMAEAVTTLDRMLKSFQAMNGLWLTTEKTVTLIGATASYALSSPARPLRILNARYRDANGYDMPMEDLTRQEYEDLPDKASGGIPTSFWFDRQKEAATLYVWPVPATVTTETVRLTIVREIEDVTEPGQVLDVPAEWYEAVVYGLADRLCDIYGVADARRGRIAAMAADRFVTARAMSMPESTFIWHA